MKVYSKDHIYPYIPHFGGTRKLPKEEQLVIGLKVVTLEDFDGYQKICLFNSKKFSVEKATELNEKRYHELIKSKFVFCEGLEIEEHEGEIDFEAIYRHVPELAQEILEVVRSSEELTVGEQKNFLPEYDGPSSAPAQKQKATTAKTATKGNGK